MCSTFIAGQMDTQEQNTKRIGVPHLHYSLFVVVMRLGIDVKLHKTSAALRQRDQTGQEPAPRGLAYTLISITTVSFAGHVRSQALEP